MLGSFPWNPHCMRNREGKKTMTGQKLNYKNNITDTRWLKTLKFKKRTSLWIICIDKIVKIKYYVNRTTYQICKY